DIPSRQDRELTEQLEEQRGLKGSTYLILRFSYGAKTYYSIVARCALNINLPLLKLLGISCFYLTFTFNYKDQLIARDLGSLYGTRVMYNKEEGEQRSNFNYLLQGPRILGNKLLVLNIIGNV
ncbi:hypothetical protein CC80DRAFT_421670, partial [Byssothecium circinans]